MAGKEPDTGPTAATVAANVTRWRRARGDLTYTQMSEQLKERSDWSINPVGVRRLEKGERQISVDDLVALAVALDVPPATLLMPDEIDKNAPTAATGTGKQPAERLWDWLCAAGQLDGDERSLTGFYSEAWPPWKQQELQSLVREVATNLTAKGILTATAVPVAEAEVTKGRKPKR